MQSACADAIGVLFAGKYSEVGFMVIMSTKKEIDESALKTEELFRQFSGLKTRLLEVNKRGGMEFEEQEKGFSIIIRDDFLFNSGRAEINSSGMSVLRAIGSRFEKFEGEVIVEGHTDNVPITTERFPSNWELSIARAVSTVKYLSEELGVSPVVLSAAGYGDTKPRASNDTPDNRSKNRRIEIILKPQIL
jgi:chemotaxis protein MotB